MKTDHATVRPQIGKGGDELMPVFLPPERVEREGRTIEAYRSHLFKRDDLDRVRPFPGIRALFERIRAADMRIALGSSGKTDEVEHDQEIPGIADLVDVVTTSDDAERSKLHPDIVEAAPKELAPLDGRSIVVVGDTPYDAEAATKAGLSTIGVLCGGVPAADLTKAGCIALYRDPQDLLDRFDESPLVAA